MEVVDNLGQDSREIDRVDGTELECLVGVIIAKERFDNVLHARSHQPLIYKPPFPASFGAPHLAIIKRSRHGNVVYVSIETGRHLRFLDLSGTHTSQLTLSRIRGAGDRLNLPG